MRKSILFCLLFVYGYAVAQEDAWIYFSDKPDADFYLANPLEMLTQRALDRRATCNVQLDVIDVPIHAAYVEQIAQSPGIIVMAKSKWLNAVHVRGTELAINALQAYPFVSEVVFADRSLNSFDRRAPRQSMPRKFETEEIFLYGSSANQIELHNGQILHEGGFTGQGKIIAVMDSGFPGVPIAGPFSRLITQNQILGGYNYVSNSPNVYALNSHGTLVLSTMGGFAVNQLIGTAPDASYLLFVTEDASSENPVEESYWVAAAEEADRLGADIINTSLGYFSYDDADYNYLYEDLNGTTSFISRGANIAFSRGMVVVVSAGNSGNSSNPYISMPADAPGALTVGAVDQNGAYASFSSVGPTADGRIKPDVVAKGVQATVSLPSGAVQTANGTSFSGPIIAGLTATLWSALPSYTHQQIVDLIKASSHLFETPTMFMGYGIPDFASAYFNGLNSVESTEQKIILFPNPAVDQVAVLYDPAAGEAAVTIYNAVGQSVLKTTTQSGAAINTQKLPYGTYFYKINIGTDNFSGKLIIR